jgi:ABC-type branched-subunit amino acid transport system substrate-binding protein
MSRRRSKIKIGVVFSVSGPYRTVGRDMFDATVLGVEHVNESSDYDFEFEIDFRDPGGEALRYGDCCTEILKSGAVSHVIGCYTSWSRKEIIPVVEKYDALLWYPSHYEGFESAPNVIYLGAAPNQHIVPLVEYMISQGRLRVYCCGSNYIWPWENNRVMRAMITAAGGAVVGERYVQIGSTDIGEIISEIAAVKPDFVFNTLIGTSSYTFFREMADAARSNGDLSSEAIPITSCSLSEPELVEIGEYAAAGHIASSVYFESIKSDANDRFVKSFRQKFGPSRVTSADAEASYNSVQLLAQAIKIAGTTEVEAIRGALKFCRFCAPQGPISIHADNNHSFLTPRLARSRRDGQFDVFWKAGKPISPDPYLSSLDLQRLRDPQWIGDTRASLRVVRS